MTTLVHVGEFLTGRITATIPVVSLAWTDVLNGNGTIDVTVTEDVVRDLDLRQHTYGGRSFLAVEVDGRIKQAGPIWSCTWDWRKGQASIGAAGMWSYFDHRVIYPSVVDGPVATWAFTVVGKSLGGIARALVANALATMSPQLPIVLPDDEAGDHTETFRMWALPIYGEQLRQITQRATDAPDIAFTPRRKPSDRRFIEWVMRVGTEAAPALRQPGPEWVFDSTSAKSPVLGITTDADDTDMAELVWVTGNGQEEGILISSANDATLLGKGWPLMESTSSFSTVEEQTTLDGHAANYLKQVARPIEVLKVSANAPAFNEVAAGDYARTITKAPVKQPDGSWSPGDPWLGDMNLTTRIKQVSGDLSDELRFDMFSVLVDL